MSTKHSVTDSRGQTYKRTSKDRVYSHAVVIRYTDGCSKAEWAGSLALAQKNASHWSGKSYVETAEIVEAKLG